MDILHGLKTRTPHLGSKCNNIHLSIVLCDQPAKAVHCHGECKGEGGGGLWKLHVGHHGDPCTFRPERNLPPPNSSVVCTQKIAGTITCENSLPLMFTTSQQATEQALGLRPQ